MSWLQFGRKFLLLLPFTVAAVLTLKIFLQLDGDFVRWREAFAIHSILTGILVAGWSAWAVVRHNSIYEKQ